MRTNLGWVRTTTFVVLSLFAGAAHARAAAINLTSPGSEFGSDFFTLGFEFTVNGPQSVTGLGVYDSLQDGLATPASVGIWLNTGGAPIASAIVPAGAAGQLDGLFRYANIAPVLLSPGVHYVVGAFIAQDVASSFNTGEGGSATVDPRVNVVQDRFSDTPFFAFPDLTNSNPGGAWLGANFKLADPAPVPEPATVTLVGLGLAGLRASRRRRT